MNLQNVHEGQVIKNYKELCALLDISEKTGNSKLSQLKELERHFKFSQMGQSFIIDEVYNESLIKMDNRKLGNRSIYVDDVSVQLLSYLADHKNERVKVGDDERMFLTARSVYLITGMINKKYIPTKQSIRAFIDETPRSLEIEDLDEFFSRTESKMREILLSSLKNLESRLIIISEKRHMIFDGKKNRITTDKEETKILDIKNKVMSEMLSSRVEKKNLGKLYFQGKLPEFYQRVNEIVFDEMGFSKVQYGFLIGYGERLEENLESYRKEFNNLMKFRYSLNGKLATFTNKDAERKYLKNKKEYEKTLDEFSKKAEDWVDKQLFLTEELIKLP